MGTSQALDTYVGRISVVLLYAAVEGGYKPLFFRVQANYLAELFVFLSHVVVNEINY